MSRTLSSLNPQDAGIWLDFSHGTSVDLDYAIVSMAHVYGYDAVDLDKLREELDTIDDFTYEEQADIQQALWEESQLAIDWLNSQITDNYYFFVDDNSLYLEYDDPEGMEYNV